MIGRIGESQGLGGTERARVREAAMQFEALLLSEVLKSARESGGGWLGSGEEGSSTTLGEYGEQAFAQVLSQQGGLGLQSLVGNSLLKRVPDSVQAQRGEKQPQVDASANLGGASVR